MPHFENDIFASLHACCLFQSLARMFFSLDLLSIRGGKMNTIWLLGTLKEKEAIIKRKKAQLLRNDPKAICR